MTYKELLLDNKWKEKCSRILQRDGYMCQDCACVGIHNQTFFPITYIDEIVDKFMPNSLFDGTSLSAKYKNIQWGEKITTPIYMDYTPLNENLYKYSMMVHQITKEEKSVITFAADTLLPNISFRENLDKKVRLQYDNKEIDGSLFAFAFKENLGTTNYASINYQVLSNLLEELDISLFFENKCLTFLFYNLNLKRDTFLFKFTPLNIHHTYYVLGKKPWEYCDEALITLCSQCHQKRHLNRPTPVYTPDKRIYTNLPPCDRCQGTGFLPQYRYYMGGICFQCQGEGVSNYDKII